MITKRRFLSLVGAGVLVSSAPSVWQATQAQPPSRPIKFIVPYPPGGVPDTLARLIGRRDILGIVRELAVHLGVDR